MQKRKIRTIKSYPKRASETPATQGMLYKVRDRLESRIDSVEHRMDAKFVIVSADIKSLEYVVKAEISKVHSEVHKIALLVEEQNAKNNIVLDGLTNLFARQERIETEVARLRKF